MIYILITLAAIGICILYIRLQLLRKSIRNARRQLHEINLEIEENRLVTLSSPDDEVEKLLAEINLTLQNVRQQMIRYAKQEREFKQQIEAVSHDLRTPLTSMLGYLKIMDTDSLSKESMADLQTILRKAESLQVLITQFYDYSRLTAQDYPLEQEAVDVARILRDALADAYGELTSRHLDVSADLPETPIYITADENGFLRIFQNLLQNAERYAVSRLEISLGQTDAGTTFFFRNDTVELDERDAERLFDRFYTANSSRKNDATGLGLTIAKELAEKMGGTLDAELKGQELEIRLYFPP